MKALPQPYDHWRGGPQGGAGAFGGPGSGTGGGGMGGGIAYYIPKHRGFLCRLPVQLFMCTQDRSCIII